MYWHPSECMLDKYFLQFLFCPCCKEIARFGSPYIAIMNDCICKNKDPFLLWHSFLGATVNIFHFVHLYFIETFDITYIPISVSKDDSP